MFQYIVIFQTGILNQVFEDLSLSNGFILNSILIHSFPLLKLLLTKIRGFEMVWVIQNYARNQF